MQERPEKTRGFMEKLKQVENNLKVMREEIIEVRGRLNRFREWPGGEDRDHAIEVRAAIEDSLKNLSPTERAVLEVLMNGPKPSPEIGRAVGKSREHTARVMKSLFEQGFVEREVRRQPYEYRLNSRVREKLGKTVAEQVTAIEH